MSYHVHINGEQRGPLSEHDFRSLVTSGLLKPTDKFFGPGMTTWVAGSEAAALLADLTPDEALAIEEASATHSSNSTYQSMQSESFRGSVGACIAIGGLSLLIGVYFLLVNPSQEIAGAYPAIVGVRVANTHRLALGETFSIIGAIFIAVGIRPRG